jgi:PAS domain S-box-containing protein
MTLTHALSSIDQRIPVYAPTGRDAALLCEVLADSHLQAVRCGHMTEFCRMIAKGAGTAVIAEEAFGDATAAHLQETLAHQPPWSDLHMIVLGKGRAEAAPYGLIPNASVLERPLRKAALVAAVRVALRARARQYQMREHLREREEAAHALIESEARFRGTFDNAAVGIAHVARDGTWLRVNQRLCDIVGYSREELLQLTFQDITHPDDLERDLHLFDVLMRGEIERYHVEKRYIHKAGHAVWIDLTTALQRDELGSPQYCIPVIVDITERKVAEAELVESAAIQHRLTAEIDHRAKNLLAVIQAIARLSAHYCTSPDSFLDAFQDRIRALALTHTVLSDGHWQGASLRQIVTAETGAFDTEGRVSFAGDDVLLKAATAQSLTMALHELATNATKYGALSTSGGRLAIAWRRRADGGLVLDWRESGGPPVRPPARTGFGRMVIEGAAGHGGAVDHRFRPEGVSCRIEVPAAGLVDAGFGDAGARTAGPAPSASPSPPPPPVGRGAPECAAEADSQRTPR